MTIPKKWAYLFCILAGLCDGSTGPLLVFAPVFTLKLMGVAVIPEDPAFIRFIGAFVGAVGFTYLFPFLFARGEARDRLLTGVLTSATIIRISIASFTTVAIATGLLDKTWISVPLSDAFLAACQIVLLKKKVFSA